MFLQKIKRFFKRKQQWWHYNYQYLMVINSPFKPLGIKFYFGEIAVGTPYFYPRKLVKTKDAHVFKYLKYFGVNYTPLGYKIKWTDTDYRFEWSPQLSIVLFKKQIVFTIVPKITNMFYLSAYWEAWLIYKNHTDKKKTKKERIDEVRQICNVPNDILKEKYHAK